MTPRDKVAASIIGAQAGLEQALADLHRLAVVDHGTLALSAHALNNYLTVTGGTVELLLGALADYPDRQVHTWLEALQHVSNLMSYTVARLMSASDLEEPPLRLERMDLVLLVQRACWYYRRHAAPKTIDLAVEVDTETALVWSDRVAVAAVLDNLLSNAVKFTPAGTRVVVRVRTEVGHFVCSVEDDGPGIDPADRARLFQPGARLGATPTAGEPSSGYGLAVARNLIDKLGGTIWCDSEPGRGARFSFRLPAVKPGDQADPRPAPVRT